MFILTLDGPSGSGKGTLGQMIATHYSWNYLDSGALYRAFAYAADRNHIAVNQSDGLAELMSSIQISFKASSTDGGSQVILNGENVTAKIRGEQAGRLASNYALDPVVRKILFTLQRQTAKPPGLVADGRDMGSVVFVEADLKIFLTASAQSRAQRRFKQLNLLGFDVNLTRLVDEISSRDEQDANRKHSPLVPARDAVVLDTTSMSIEDVFKDIINRIDNKMVMTTPL